MTLEEVKKLVLESDTYKFLRTDKHLGKNIMFLCLGGSYSYGTNVEGSDLDVRGVYLNSERSLFGMDTKDEYENKELDCKLYSFTKFIKLVSDCNPNVIEMLFCKPEHYLYVSPLGQLILDNRKLFLSKKAYYTFSGYARAQLNRLENLQMRQDDVLTEEQAQVHMLRSLQNAAANCHEKLSLTEDDGLKLYVDKVGEDDFDEQYAIFADVDLKHIKVADFNVILAEISNVLKDYKNGVGNCNKKKDDLHMNKHMMHLVRLFYMGCEILETGDLHTYRTVEHDLLMKIRNGEFRNEDGSVKDELYDLITELSVRLDKAVDSDAVPSRINREEVFEKVTKPIYNYVVENHVEWKED